MSKGSACFDKRYSIFCWNDIWLLRLPLFDSVEAERNFFAKAEDCVKPLYIWIDVNPDKNGFVDENKRKDIQQIITYLKNYIDFYLRYHPWNWRIFGVFIAFSSFKLIFSNGEGQAVYKIINYYTNGSF